MMNELLEDHEQSYLIDSPSHLLAHLQRDFEVMQLIQGDNDQFSWGKSESEDTEPSFGADCLPNVSPKGLFFVDNEPLYTFDGETFESVKLTANTIAIFGAQACDLAALAYQDRFFAEDPYYQQRRKNALIIGVDCEAPCEHGFCVEMNAGPHVAKEVADIVLSRIYHDDSSEYSWLMIVQSTKGRDSIAGMSLRLAGQRMLALRQQQFQSVVAQFPNRDYIHSGVKHLNARQVPNSLWQAFGEHCLASVGGASLCPTCSCFTVNETPFVAENTGLQGYTTIRSWDSCLTEDFQQEASGHNPGHDPAKRIERFWFHKFSNEYLGEFGRYGCVGCGRCENAYPGTFGVHSMLQRVDQSCSN